MFHYHLYYLKKNGNHGDEDENDLHSFGVRWETKQRPREGELTRNVRESFFRRGRNGGAEGFFFVYIALGSQTDQYFSYPPQAPHTRQGARTNFFPVIVSNMLSYANLSDVFKDVILGRIHVVITYISFLFILEPYASRSPLSLYS